ncbi:TonB-dependent receptor [Edaphobacter bradus]|uniref:TonB-dependent receptor n=1 Tax=Edaphobacter bradus TaxID=2259016 RepID=UPI0021DFD6E7|nr:TonB-dependent receptor [Edaphobacter bradus]
MLFILSLLCITGASGQTGKGAVAGTITDTSQAVLPGALVELLPLGKKVVSDTQGQFKITDVAPGEYTLSVSYIGFRSLTTAVTVSSGQVTKVDSALKVGSQTDEVLVSGERLHGQAEAINIQRTAENIVQVLPAQVITSLPNTNIADAVGRLPSVTLERDEGEGKYVQIRGTEPRLSNTTIDGVNVPSPEGNVRNIKLDVIPSSLVDRIEVNKTLSANQDGDAIGGSVNLVTKSAGDRPTFTIGAQGGYTPIQDGRWLNSFDATYGRRYGAKKKFGFLLGTTYDFNGRGIDDLEPLPVAGTDDNGNNVAYFATADLRTYKYYRTRYGFAGGMDYNFNDKVNAYVKGLYSDFHDYGDTWVYSPTGSSFTDATGATINMVHSVSGSKANFYTSAECDAYNAANPSLPQCSAGNMAFRHYIRRPDQQIFSVLTGLHQEIGGATLITYEFAGSRSHNIGGQDFPTTNFNGPNVDFQGDFSNPRRPQFNAPNGMSLAGTSIYDPTQYTVGKTLIPHYHSTQLNFQGALSAARSYNVASHYGTLELGIKIRNAHKTQFQNDQIYKSPSPIPLSNLLSVQTAPNYYDNSYKFGHLTDYNKIVRQLNQTPGALGPVDVDASRIQSDPAVYAANERVYAGYAMNTIGIGRFRFQAGLRIEATDTTYNANQVLLNNGAYDSTVPITGSSGYINILPSVQMQYRVDNNTTLRATYGRGISRPNFSDIVPSQQVDPNTTPPSLVRGNPGLQPTSANNYDVLVEHFSKSLGQVQAGFFYKDLSNPIYPTAFVISDPTSPFNGYRVNQAINGPNGHILGFEAAVEQRLSRLPGLFNGLGVSANYSYTSSQVNFPTGFGGGRPDHPSLQRQAPNTYNVGMTYDKARFSGRFGLSHNDANIYAYNYSGDATAIKDPVIGLKGPGGDVYLYAHTQYDVQGSYRLVKALQLVVSGLNLSNEVFGFYQGSKQYPIQREYYHPSVIFGLRWNSSAE